jgi:hypothetical protein
MYWDWQSGRPRTRPIRITDDTLKLTTKGGDTAVPIQQLPVNNATQILGVHLSPEGNFSDQIIILKKKTDNFSVRLQSPKLTPQDNETFHRTTYGPAMRYVLPTLVIDEEALAPIQTKILASMLQKLGYSSKLHTALRHGPINMGGLALIDLRTELGIYTIKYMRDTIYKESETRKRDAPECKIFLNRIRPGRTSP